MCLHRFESVFALSARMLTILMLLLWHGRADSSPIPLFPGGQGISVEVESFQQRRFAGLHRQRFDMSCGSAAVSTLLSHHYEDPVEEQEVFRRMYEAGEQERIRQQGFSLLDMKNYLNARGYRAEGYRVSLEQYRKAGVAAIALVNDRGFEHFVVIKGVQEGQVLLGDPAEGNRVLEQEEFEASWNGILLLIRNERELGQSRFNEGNAWESIAAYPLASVRPGTDLGIFTLLLRSPEDH